VRPATRVNDLRSSDLIVGRVTVRLQKTFELSQKLFWSIPSSAQTEVEHHRDASRSSWSKELDPYRKLAGGTEDCDDNFGGGELPPIEASSARLSDRSSSRAHGSPDPAPTECYSRLVDRPASRATIALCAMIEAFEDPCLVGGSKDSRCLRPSSRAF
jgi:hypothetical protein